MYKELKERVLEANLDLPRYGLVTFTWGNVSAIDREKSVVAIKPSGVKYENMHVDDIVVIDLKGNIVEGNLRPSSDTPTHLELYKAFKNINGIVHTHSTYATSWAQARREVPCYGTTHADYFYGNIPCTRNLTSIEIESEYEKNTGLIIVEKFKKLNPLEVPGVLVPNHGPFSFGKNANEAVHNAVVLEEVSKMAYLSENIEKNIKEAPTNIKNKHYFRKHGANAYYGQ
jgi:L-ribulose-5-phosphate 4-epimerase